VLNPREDEIMIKVHLSIRTVGCALTLAGAILQVHCTSQNDTRPDATDSQRDARENGGGANVADAADATDQDATRAGPADRAYHVQVLTRIAEPVLAALSHGELKWRMPIHAWEIERAAFTHYEAFARTLAGIAPWLELGGDPTPEGQERSRFIDLARRALINATDPSSPDYLNFGGEEGDQPLVEAAYFAAALLAAPTQLWQPLTDAQRGHVVAALRTHRTIPNVHNNNWILFPAMAEAALWKLTGDFRIEPIENAVKTFEREWYLGDGVYGDGPEFHWDYYNSYVIHPMLLQVLEVAEANQHPIASSLAAAKARALRYANVLERLISPEGTFPVMGRSSAYRFASLYHLSYMALRRDLPREVDAGAVRSAMTIVIRRMVEAPGTFDDQGWLQLGAVGHQPGLQETYNATGSLYVCLTGMVHLGLRASDPFWTAPTAAWTQRRIWAGENVPRDERLDPGAN
jgi:hypothetical protein